MTALVIAEHDHQHLKPSTRSTITAALQLSQEIALLVAGFQCHSVVEECQKIQGVKTVLSADHEVYQHPLAESITPLILECAQSATYILAPATTFGKNTLPRVAAKLGVSQVSDIIEVVDECTYRRPIYAGNAIATVQSKDAVQVITVRSSAFEAASDGSQVAPVNVIGFIADNQSSTFLREELHLSDRPELSSAQIVISGGRGLQTKESFERLMKIADRMGAAMGASLAAVDASMAPNDFQVGQTGQIVAPTLYIAVGISGAIQHLAGMKESKIIVAINRDPDAPIFQIADYGLVADLADVLPEWEDALDKMTE